MKRLESLFIKFPKNSLSHKVKGMVRMIFVNDYIVNDIPLTVMLAFSRDPSKKVRSSIFNTVFAHIPFTSIQLHMNLVQTALKIQRKLLTLLTPCPGYGKGTGFQQGSK